MKTTNAPIKELQQRNLLGMVSRKTLAGVVGCITSLGEERAKLSAFRTFVRFVLVWICRFLLPFGVWEGLRFVIVAFPGLFSYLFLQIKLSHLCGYK